MNLRIFAFYIVLALIIPSLAYSADQLRAHYEVNVQEGNNIKTVHMAENFTSGVTVEHEMGKYTLSLLINVAPSNDYVLKISLTPSESRGIIVATGSFNGQLSGPQNGPLEFNMEKNGIKVFGAMAISSIKSNKQ